MEINLSGTCLSHSSLTCVSRRCHAADSVNLSGTKFGCPLVRITPGKLYEVEYISADLDGFAFFCRGLAEQSSIKSLNLASNDITSHQIIDYLCPALRQNLVLKNLDISRNLMSDDAYQALLSVIEESGTSLQKIKIAPNIVLRNAKKKQRKLNKLLRQKKHEIDHWFKWAPVLANEKYNKEHLFKYSFRDLSHIITSYQ